MGWSALSFLAEPWFVLPWYAVGVVGLALVAYDVTKNRTDVPPAMKWAWPIIVLFFSAIGLVLYFATARGQSTFRHVNGAVIHCVAGDGLGIMTAMVIARATNITFWEEFWFEYLVGFCFGLFIFQRKALGSLGKAFRAEFFSMLTVMGGMGAVMTFVTPSVVGAQPKPLTYAFWGFGMLGLLAGYVLTFPMNWMLVKIGWKHGPHPVETRGAKLALAGAMVSLGIAALVLVAWLAERREGTPLAGAPALELEPDGKIDAAQIGLFESVLISADDLARGRRREATNALDSARRAAEVGTEAFPHSGFRQALHDVERARHSLEMGDPRGAEQRLLVSLGDVGALRRSSERIAKPLRAYRDAPVVNAQGVVIGEVQRIEGDRVWIALGGGRDVWGFWDIRTERSVTIAKDDLLFGPAHTMGRSFVMLPTLETKPESAVARWARADCIAPASGARFAGRVPGDTRKPCGSEVAQP